MNELLKLSGLTWNDRSGGTATLDASMSTDGTLTLRITLSDESGTIQNIWEMAQEIPETSEEACRDLVEGLRRASPDVVVDGSRELLPFELVPIDWLRMTPPLSSRQVERRYRRLGGPREDILPKRPSTPGPSTRRLDALPEPTRLRALCMSLALLDEMLSLGGEYRQYFFEVDDSGNALARYASGSGDRWAIWYGDDDVLITGFAHESPISPFAREDGSPWPGIVDELPSKFARLLDEETRLDGQILTFCIWREGANAPYRVGKIDVPAEAREDADGSEDLLKMLTEDLEVFATDFEYMYRTKLDREAVRRIHSHRPLDAGTVQLLEECASFEAIAKSAAAMGYPLAG